MSKLDGGPFVASGTEFPKPEERINMRDHFAGLAMQVLCRSPSIHGNNKFKITAQRSYQYADAMLAERQK